MKKNLMKYLMVILMLATGTLVYVYAQKGYFFRKAETKTENKVEEEEPTEDIGILTSDDPWKEIDKLVAAYYNKEGVSYKGAVRLIDDNGDQEKIIEENKFEYLTVGRNMYYRLGNMEFISKTDLLLVADHNNKFISVSQQNPRSDKTNKLFNIGEFKKLMEQSKAEAKVTQLGDQKILTIEKITDPQIQGYRIYYDPQTYKVTKMLIGMLRLSPLSDDEGGIDEIPWDSDNKTEENINDSEEGNENEIETYTYYLEIIYDEMKVLNISEKTFHPENKFIVISENKIQLMPVFSKYQLISNGEMQNETEKLSGEEE